MTHQTLPHRRRGNSTQAWYLQTHADHTGKHARRHHPIDATAIDGWHTAILALQHLQTHYPNTWHAVAGLRLTPHRAWYGIRYWLHLVDQQLPLLWDAPTLEDDRPGAQDYGMLQRCGRARDDHVYLELISHTAPFLDGPRPALYGCTLHTSWDDTADASPQAIPLLTWALWFFAERTHWGVGRPLGSYVRAAYGSELWDFLGDLPQLPAQVRMWAVCDALCPPTRQVAPLGELVALCFGGTTNVLANYHRDDVTLLGTRMEFDWDDLPRLIRLARQARRWANGYAAWNTQVEADPRTTLPELAHRLRTAGEEALRRAGPYRAVETRTISSQEWVSGLHLPGNHRRRTGLHL